MIEINKLIKGNEKELLSSIIERRVNDNKEIVQVVGEIITKVRNDGDKALRNFTEKFDGVIIQDFLVSNKEIEEAFENADKEFIDALNESKENIENYHKMQKKYGYMYTKDLGIYMGQRIIPLERVGVYVPGGTAAYPSSVLMNVIPAKVAGVKEIIMVTPPDKNGKVNSNILVAAKIAEVDKIYKIGGAQAIAALCYGTESIKSVSKVVGPGNAYVAEAKKQVFGSIGIDMVAGPSEILIIADEKANPRFIAADLMSQAEHDVKASSILITTSLDIANKVKEELEIQVKELERKEIIKKSLKDYGKIIITDNIDSAIELANLIAPEHLEILTVNPMEKLNKIVNAASVFIGEYTPEPVGDYFGGTNHVLPTCGTAIFSSPLSVDDFVKKSSYLYYSEEAILRDGNKIMKIANEEGLTAHENAVKVRLK